MEQKLRELASEAERHFYLHEWDQAKEIYEKILENDRENEEACSRLIQIFSIRGLLSDAIMQNYVLVRILADKGCVGKAIETAKKALRLHPEDERLRKKIIVLYKRMDDQISFIRECNELARFYLEKGMEDYSVRLLQKLLELCPGDLDLEMKIADMHMKLGNINEAAEQYRRLADIYLTRDMKSEALTALKRLRVVVPPDMIFLMTLGGLYTELGNLDAAESEYRAALKIDINSVVILKALAEVCSRKGCYRDAIIAHNKILHIDPQDISSKEKLGELYGLCGNQSQALKYYLEAATHYQREEQLEKAVGSYRKVLEYEPLNPTALRETEKIEKMFGLESTQGRMG